MNKTEKRNALVLAGNEIKLRLMAERTATRTPVHVDWVRFTVQRRNLQAPAVDYLFPQPPTGARSTSIWDCANRHEKLARLIAQTPDCDSDAAAQAMDLARECAEALGPDYAVHPEPRKGHDFYRFRFSIERTGVEVGWVGFQASSDSPRQKAQAATVHANLYGAACTFASRGWNDRLATVIEERDGDLTRCDLALDFFDGLPGGMERIAADYRAGLCDVGGKRLKCNRLGDWDNSDAQRTNGRSFYIGSKEAGKQTNAYEKGHQLFGIEAGNPWLRIELRYGNKLRELSPEMLRRPADFFAGASDWHLSMLALSDTVQCIEKVKCRGRLALETVKAEVTRNVRWLRQTAAPTLAVAIQYLGEEKLWELLEGCSLPGRLQRFTPDELSRAFDDATNKTVGCPGPAFVQPQPLAA